MLQSVREVGEITRQVQTTVWSQPLSYGINKTNRFAQSASAYEFHNEPEKMDLLFAQAKSLMSYPGGIVSLFRAHRDGDLDFRSTDHEHVNSSIRQGFEKFRSHP